MKWVRQNILSFWTVFCPFYPPMDPKNQNFEPPPPPKKKTPGDIIIGSFFEYNTWRYHNFKKVNQES